MSCWNIDLKCHKLHQFYIHSSTAQTADWLYHNINCYSRCLYLCTELVGFTSHQGPGLNMLSLIYLINKFLKHCSLIMDHIWFKLFEAFYAQVSCYSAQLAKKLKGSFLLEFAALEDMDLSLDYGHVIVAVCRFSSWRPRPIWRNFLTQIHVFPSSQIQKKGTSAHWAKTIRPKLKKSANYWASKLQWHIWWGNNIKDPMRLQNMISSLNAGPNIPDRCFLK